MTTPSFRDVEQISILLDEKLTQEDAARLKLQIASDPELASIYRQLFQARALLRNLPAHRAPRNFTLTPEMAGVKAPTPRVIPLFRFASVFASLLLVLTFAVNGLGQLAVTVPAAAPAYGIGGGPITENLEAPSASEPRPQSGGGAELEQPALAAPSAVAEDAANSSTGEAMIPAAESTQVVSEEIPAAKAGGEEYSTRRQPEPLTPSIFRIPAWLQAGLLAAALLAGGAAWIVTWQANARFARKSRK